MNLDWKYLLPQNKDYPPEATLPVRDPKVWKQDGNYYVIQGARMREGTGAALIFESEDGLQWNYINTLRTARPFGYMWECPDLFALDGQWILIFVLKACSRKNRL